jgi:hypothetical protein
MVPWPETGIAHVRFHNLRKAKRLQNRLRLVVDWNQLLQTAVTAELCSLTMSRNRFC